MECKIGRFKFEGMIFQNCYVLPYMDVQDDYLIFRSVTNGETQYQIPRSYVLRLQGEENFVLVFTKKGSVYVNKSDIVRGFTPYVRFDCLNKDVMEIDTENGLYRVIRPIRKKTMIIPIKPHVDLKVVFKV